jgi:CheY-like chemotaxis protein
MKLDDQRVLIVDDEPDHRLIIRILLNKLWSPRLSFVEVCNGKEAVFLAQHWQPDLILMNLKMIEMDGCEAIRQIRVLEARRMSELGELALSHPSWIVATSTNIRKAERDRARVAGCNAFLGKPFCIDELLASLPGNISLATPLDPNQSYLIHVS